MTREQLEVILRLMDAKLNNKALWPGYYERAIQLCDSPAPKPRRRLYVNQYRAGGMYAYDTPTEADAARVKGIPQPIRLIVEVIDE